MALSQPVLQKLMTLLNPSDTKYWKLPNNFSLAFLIIFGIENLTHFYLGCFRKIRPPLTDATSQMPWLTEQGIPPPTLIPKSISMLWYLVPLLPRLTVPPTFSTQKINHCRESDVVQHKLIKALSRLNGTSDWDSCQLISMLYGQTVVTNGLGV